jgi:hypothetical protein
VEDSEKSEWGQKKSAKVVLDTQTATVACSRVQDIAEGRTTGDIHGTFSLIH